MTTFSVKMPDDLHDSLQRYLRESGKSRSAFVRELIERELHGKADAKAQLRRGWMEFAGALQVSANSAVFEHRAVAADKKRFLLEQGYGTGHAVDRR